MILKKLLTVQYSVRPEGRSYRKINITTGIISIIYFCIGSIAIGVIRSRIIISAVIISTRGLIGRS